MIRHFDGNTADEVWQEAAAALLTCDDAIHQDSRLGPTREYLHATFHVRDPRQRWVLSRRPAINPAFGIVELIWILLGRDDADLPTYWNPLLPKFVGEAKRYHGAYGHRLRVAFGIDQLEHAYTALAANHKSRQVVLQIWDVTRDMPNPDGSARDTDIPCNVVAMPKIRDGQLEWLQVMRSNDLYLGTPHNFIQFMTLQEILAGWLRVEVGSYVQISDSLHLYEGDMKRIAFAQDVSIYRNNDNLAIPKADFDRTLPEIGRYLDELRCEGLTLERFRYIIVGSAALPSGWHHMLLVAAADAARRRRWHEEAEAAMAGCLNPALSAAWQAWSERRSHAEAASNSSP